MNKKRLKEQVETIRQAFGYITRFRGQTFVIKLDSALFGNAYFPILIKDLVLLHQMGIRIVLVPGAKQRIDQILATYNIKTHTVKGVRISPPDAVSYIKMAAFDVCNKLMTLLAENDTHAIIGNWVKARAIGVRDGVDFLSSGTVESLQTDIVRRTLDQGQIPIFPNIGWNAKGKPYNISSNELALALGRELGAAKLFFITGFGGISGRKTRVPPGVYVSSDGTISQMTVTQAGGFLDINASSRQSTALELVSLAYEACRGGIPRVHIVDGRVEGMVLKEIFSNRGFGTMIYANQHENVRPMVPADIPEVLRIMEPSVGEAALVPRTAGQLEKDLEAFAVYEVDGTIHGCGALHAFPGKTGEIAGLAIDQAYANLGSGARIVSYLIEKASTLKLKKLFVLTTQTWDWFASLGFTPGTLNDLPAEKKKAYNRKRKSRVLTYSISPRRTKRPSVVE
ncbi:MAG: amino-acid N-acetyltransferase [Chitinivibrionales bacterium]|nr:amino-acid N-acetyltransferase [Chitinivibrionales bacterium]MBD3395397.1 amino-acid N-acetyltransferase [Chitinivibrionales bacterium]